MINSVIGLFYYVRVIVTMVADGRRDDRQADNAQALHVAYGGGLVLAMLSGLLFGLGVYPASLIRLVQTIERSLTG